MKRIYQWIRNTFGFSKTESNGFVILIPLMVVSVFLPVLLRQYFLNQSISTFNTQSADSLMQVLNDRIVYKKQQQEQSYQWQKRYDKSEHAKKNGRVDLYPKNNSKSKFEKNNKKVTKVPEPKTTQEFDINVADTSQLKKIYGIGPVLSNRIVKYRDLLGGFVSMQQLNDVYGLEGEALDLLKKQSFVSKEFVPSQLSVNELKSYQLDDHPYISKKTARAIDNYRFQHGAIENVNTLYNLHMLDSAIIQKISPYLKF